jgi:hypothetical protein
MANNLKITNAMRNAACNAIVDSLDTGGAGTIKIYDGTQAATADTAISTQNLLVTITLNSTAFGNASNGVATLNGVPLSGTAGATGTASWFRMANGSGTTILDGSVGTSNADLILNTTSILNGNTVQVTSGTLTMPAS